MLRVPAPGSRGAISVPQERKSLTMTTSRGLCVVRLFGRQPLIGSLRKATIERRNGGASSVIKAKKQGEEVNIASRWPPP